MSDDLSHLRSSEIDALPFGYIALAPDGTVRQYNRYEADLARKDPKEVLGKNFFQEVAPCTRVQEFEGRFREFAEGTLGRSTLSFDFEFAFRHGTQKVRIGFVRSPLQREVIVTVNRLRDLELPIEPRLEHRAMEGRWIDSTGRPVVAAGADFWLALDRLYAGQPETERRRILHQLGKAWGLAQVERIESFVQKRHGETLREVELQVALQNLSGAIGVAGLGAFEVQLGYRDRGLLVITHRHSPFVTVPVDHDHERCQILAGLHAGFLTHLSGRDLVGREVGCSRSVDLPCRFVVGTESRLERLFAADAGSTDADLLAGLRQGARPAAASGSANGSGDGDD